MDMDSAALHSIICPVFIGHMTHMTHLQALRHLIEQVCVGQGQTVLVAGEAGIGKSRLVVEATMHLRSVTVCKLRGHCFEQDSTLPYAPLLDLLRSFFSSHSLEEITTFPVAPERVKRLPELTPFLFETAPGTSLEPEQEKRCLHQGLPGFFRHLTATQPLMLIIEDVHWSDDASLEFLLFLARRIAWYPILLLLTYRSEEQQVPFTRFLAGLDRERLATELLLTRLDRKEVETMMQALLPLRYPMCAKMLEKIDALTEGNPFFIEEVLKSLITSGQLSWTKGVLEFKLQAEANGLVQIPRNVQLAVKQRLDHVSPSARQLLNFAAVAGRHFDFALLQQLMQQSESELILLFKEVITAQLVVETSEERFAFRHALTRQRVTSRCCPSTPIMR